MKGFLPDNLIKPSDTSKFLFFAYMKESLFNRREWFLFNRELLNYKENNYHYRTIFENGCLYYYEFYNNKQIASIIFDDPEYMDILKLTEDKICSIGYLYSEISNKSQEITMKNLMEMVNSLKKKYLLYVNEDFTEIVSTIKIEKSYL